MRKLARIETILSIDPIEGADRIEVATVQSWRVVVKKGVFKVGDLALFFEIDSLLPLRPWSSFLFKDKRELYRLRTVKLRGVVSQGLLVPTSEIIELANRDITEGEDLTEVLGIQKWEMVIPAQLAGQVKGNFPSFVRKSDEERIQNARYVVDEIKNIPIYVSIKCDGTSMTCYKHEGVFGVCSRNLDLREEGGDSYWAMAKELDLPAKLPDGFAIQGELVGPGIQGNKMGLTKKTLYLFNAWDIKNQRYLNHDEFISFAASLGVEPVPMVSINWVENKPASVDEWLTFASALNYPNGKPAEGVVIRPMTERYSPALDGRLSFKVISNRFLLTTGE
jgi:RNA ligase (TIGR02306 family)